MSEKEFCDICGDEIAEDERLLECRKCIRRGGTGCCMMGGVGVPCCECEESGDDEDDN